MNDLTDQERAVLAKAYATPDTTPDEIAEELDLAESKVETILREHDESAIADAAGRTDWDDPTTCPFCGGALRDGGAGFMDHIDENEACELGFERWRESVAGDIGGEWIG